MLRSSLRQKSSQLLKAGCSARTLCSASRPSLISANAHSKNPSISKRQTVRVISQKRHATAAASAPDSNDSFLSGNTANYIDEMYMQWKEDPTSVHISWQVYFRNMETGDMPMSQAFTPPPTLIPTPAGGVPSFMPGMGMAGGQSDVTNHLKVQLLVRAYQARGHHKANIDPLGIRREAEEFGYSKPKELQLEHYQFTEKDLDNEYELGPGILPRFKKEGREKMSLRDIIAACERIYCGSYGTGCDSELKLSSLSSTQLMRNVASWIV